MSQYKTIFGQVSPIPEPSECPSCSSKNSLLEGACVECGEANPSFDPHSESPMTNAELAEIEGKLLAASPGPWIKAGPLDCVDDVWRPVIGKPGPRGADATSDSEMESVVLYLPEGKDLSPDPADEEFLVSSWETVRRLLAEVKRLRRKEASGRL